MSEITQPLVCVVMRIHAKRDFFYSVQSVIAQTYTNWKLVLSFDGEIYYHSRDAQISICKNPKIIIHKYTPFYLKEEYGYRPSDHLNQAFEQVQDAKYIMVLDSDDFMFPNKIMTQVQYMEKKEQLSVLGSQYVLINSKRKMIFNKFLYPISDRKIRHVSKYRQPFVHSSVIMRAEDFRSIGGYDLFFRFGEERDLFLRLLEKGRGHNLRKALVVYTTGRTEDEEDYPRTDLHFWKLLIDLIPIFRKVTQNLYLENYIGNEKSWLISFLQRIENEEKLSSLEKAYLKIQIDKAKFLAGQLSTFHHYRWIGLCMHCIDSIRISMGWRARIIYLIVSHWYYTRKVRKFFNMLSQKEN